MQDIVIKTRITPRKLIERIISRERLLKLLESNLYKNIILLTAPAGYGKTTLLLDFLDKMNIRFAWLYIAPDIENFYEFTNYFIHSLKSLKETFGEKTLELLSSLSESGALVNDEKNSTTAVAGTFINEFVSTFDDEVYLVIDDLQNAGNSTWLINTFNSLIEDFPQNLHILITSRTLPEFNIAKLDAKRNMLRINASELNFTFDETEKLLNEIYTINCDKAEISKLEDKLEGWITGLHLILQAYGNNFSSFISAEKTIDDNVFDYFANEIFNNLDNEIKNFLLTTCMVDSFTDKMCAVLMENVDSVKMIKRLRKKNIFIETSLSDEPGKGITASHSYHNLFKQFLLKKLHDLKNENEIKEIAEKIFRYYIQKDEIIPAIDYCLYSERYEKAAEMIINSFDEVFQSGRYELLDKWVKSLPSGISNNDPFIRLYMARLLYRYKSDAEQALGILEKLIKATNENSEIYLQACIEYSDILLIKGKAKDAVKILEDLVKSKREPGAKTKASLALAKTYYSMGFEFYDKIISLLDKTIKLNEENDIRQFHAGIYFWYARIHQNRGELSKSLHYFKNVVELEKNIFRKFQTLTDIVLLHAWSGEYLKAKAYLDKAEEIFRRFRIAAFERGMIRINALFKFESGDYEDSILKFTELTALDRKNNIQSFIFLYNMFIAESYILLEMNNKAKEFIELAEKTGQKNDSFQNLLIDYHKAIVNNLNTPDEHTEKILLETHRVLEYQNLFYSKVQVEFHLADYYYKTGNPETCLKFLRESLNESSQKQFNSFLYQHFINKRYLFDYASSQGVQKDYISSLHTQLLERNSFEWLSEDCKRRLEKSLKKLSDVTANCFGGTEIYVRGIQVSEDKWIRKKSKLLFLYLLINKEQKHTKDKIMELFFGDLSASSADNVFHQAITNIRAIAKPEISNPQIIGNKSLKKSKLKTPESFVVYEDKILQIAPQYKFYVDVVEFNKLYSQIKSLQTDESTKEILARKALNLYKGEFLPGYYDEWIEELRTNLQNKFIEICEELLIILNKQEKYYEIISYSERLISSDKLHETAFLNLVTAYVRTGNMNMAKKKFAELLKNYEDEYGEKPSKQTLNQIEKILMESE